MAVTLASASLVTGSQGTPSNQFSMEAVEVIFLRHKIEKLSTVPGRGASSGDRELDLGCDFGQVPGLSEPQFGQQQHEPSLRGVL